MLYSSQWSRSRCFSGLALLFLWLNGVDNLISGSPTFSKSSLYSWKFSVHVLLTPCLKNYEHYLALEGMMLKVKLQYFGHLTRRVDSLEKTLMLGGIGGRRRRGRPRMRWRRGITDSMDMSLSELRELVGDGQEGLACCDSWGHKESDTTEPLNWSELRTMLNCDGSNGRVWNKHGTFLVK